MNTDTKYNKKGIVIHINSYGGCVTSAFGIINTIKSSKLPIISIVEGVCMSAATLVFVVSDYSLMCEYSHFLIHQMSYGLGGRHDYMSFFVDLSGNLLESLKNVLLDYSKLTTEQLDVLIKTETILDANKCIEYGLADDIYIPPKKTMTKLSNELHIYKYHSIYLYNITADDELSLSTANVVYQICNPRHDILLRFKASYNSYSPTTEIRRILPIINTIQNTKHHVYALIDGYQADIDILIYLVCNARYIHKDTMMHFNFINLRSLSPAMELSDIVSNTTMIKEMIMKILDKHTKLPDNIKANVFNNRYIFNSNDALKYKLCDVVLN
jgi:ATP-dependent protease ClpP protease subunit